MRFIFTSVLAIAALVSSSTAQVVQCGNNTVAPAVLKPAAGDTYVGGQMNTIAWEAQLCGGNNTLTLLQGSATSLQSIQQIATGVDDSQGSYFWTLPATFTTANNYVIRLDNPIYGTVYSSSFSIQHDAISPAPANTAAADAFTVAAQTKTLPTPSVATRPPNANFTTFSQTTVAASGATSAAAEASTTAASDANVNGFDSKVWGAFAMAVAGAIFMF